MPAGGLPCMGLLAQGRPLLQRPSSPVGYVEARQSAQAENSSITGVHAIQKMILMSALTLIDEPHLLALMTLEQRRSLHGLPRSCSYS